MGPAGHVNIDLSAPVGLFDLLDCVELSLPVMPDEILPNRLGLGFLVSGAHGARVWPGYCTQTHSCC